MHSGLLTIDLNAIAKNYRLICDKVGEDCAVFPVLKANAYGLGIKAVAQKLVQEGAQSFFTATLNEALELREIIGNAPQIFTLCGFDDARAAEYTARAITPVINSLPELAAYRKTASQPLPAILHFDTAMNRLGIEPSATANMASDIGNIDIRAIMSHFACADEKHALTRTQYDRFQEITKHFPNAPKSLSNSAGIFQSKEYHLDITRPGMALYGLNPTPAYKNPMQPVVKLDAPILQIRNVEKGETCGYGGAYTFPASTKLATIGIGYADGYARALSNAGALYWKNHRCPVRGRISMDLTMIDLGDIPESDLPKAGDTIEVMGPNQSADALAADANTIGYEILTSLGHRYERRYID